jgi:cytochrome oxidase Cu insertion factor (SCO1/SenC/PrrC family)
MAGGRAATGRRWRRRRVAVTLSVAAALLIAVNVYAAVVVEGQRSASSGGPRPSGIPANVPTGLANMMELSPVSGVAPGFTLTDQHGRTIALSSLRGKAVVLEFMDPHCTDICPIVSQEFLTAEHYLGPLAGRVVFAAVNVNQYFHSVRDMAVYSREHQLDTLPDWHFLTGAVPALRAVWRDYHIEVQAPSRNADILHTSAIYFISPAGTERFLATPMVDHTAGGTAYLPLAQTQDWARGIAAIARDLAR